MLLFSPEYLGIRTTDILPLSVSGYKINNTVALYGETPEGKYLFQDIYTSNFHGCFINVFPEQTHRFFFSKNNTGYFLLVQLQNTLQCSFQGLPETNIYEWGINLFAASKLHAEIKVSTDFSTFVLFIPDKYINRCAINSPVMKKFKRTHEQTTHTVKLLLNNAISNFAMIDLINEAKENETIKPETLNEIFKQAMKIVCSNRTPKQPMIPGTLADKMQSLKQYLANNITIDFDREHLLNDFKISVYHFENTFKKIYNVTPFTILKYYRMQQVKKELQQNKTSLKELANRFHYSYNAIGKAYKSVYKTLPIYKTNNSKRKK
jgi:AraC-like DNA-binding protein